MNIYLTTDTHFFHKRMINEDWRQKNYESLILEDFKKLKEDDILIHLGDICVGHDTETHESYFKPLKCKKWLIRGNHDRKSFTWYSKYWDMVCDSLSLNIYGQTVLLTHKPAPDGDYDNNIHGHMHNNHREYETEETAKQILLALEYTDYKLVTLKEALNA